MALVDARSQFQPSTGEEDFVPFPATVLIADDDASVRRLLKIAFELDGYRTITAADGDEAVAAVRLHQPAVVIVDAAMPGRTGTAVTRAIRSELGWGPTVIMLTGRTDVADGLAGRLGAQDFIALVDPPRAEQFTTDLRSGFDARRPSFYDPVDALRGWIDVTDRTGRTRRHRPVRMAVGVAASPGGFGVSPEGVVPQVLHHLDLLERAAELARYARTATGGPIAFDRRA